MSKPFFLFILLFIYFFFQILQFCRHGNCHIIYDLMLANDLRYQHCRCHRIPRWANITNFTVFAWFRHGYLIVWFIHLILSFESSLKMLKELLNLNHLMKLNYLGTSGQWDHGISTFVASVMYSGTQTLAVCYLKLRN